MNPGFNSVWTLSQDGQNAGPVVAVGSGNAASYVVCGWSHYDGTWSSIQTVTYPFTPVPPPTDLSVMSQVSDFGVYQSLNYLVSWTPVSSSDVNGYTILRNGNFAGWVSAPLSEYLDYNRTSDQSVTYSVYAVDMFGRNSEISSVTFPSP
jgi:hypothetical protein